MAVPDLEKDAGKGREGGREGGGGSEKIPLLNGFGHATALFLPSGHGC